MAYYDVDWSPRFNFGGPRSTANLRGVCIHTTENAAGTPAENVANYQINSQSGSYHMLVDTTGKRLRENTDDWITWSTGNQGNNLLLHISFVAYARWSRSEWLAQDKMLRAGATVVAHWCKTYRFPVRQVGVAGLPGITTHDATRVWGSTDHTDPGPNFPWDVFLRYVNEAMGGTPAPKPQEGITVDQADRIIKHLQDFIAGFVGPVGSDVKDVREQLCGAGSRDAGTFEGWQQLGTDSNGNYLTLVDAVAALRRDLDNVRKEIKR